MFYVKSPTAVTRELIGELISRAAHHCGVSGAREAFSNVQDVSTRFSRRAPQEVSWR